MLSSIKLHQMMIFGGINEKDSRHCMKGAII